MTGKGLSRRDFLKAAALGSAGVVVTACAPQATPTVAPETADQGAKPGALTAENITLKVLAENWGDVYNNLMTVIGDEYTKEHPNIKVEWEFDPDWRTKLTTLLAANTPPDLAFMRPDFLASVAPKGVLLPLDTYLSTAGAKRDDFVLPLYDSGVYEGKLYGMPGGADYWCLYYSKDIYKDVGLDTEAPPKTIAEVEDHSQKVLKKDNDGNIERAAMMYSSQWLSQWIFLFGGSLYDDPNHKITANDPKNVEAFTWLKNYFQSMGNIDQLTAFAQRPGFFDAGNPFATRNCSYVLDGFWYYESIDTHAPDLSYGVNYWPTKTSAEEEKKNWMLGGWHYSLPKGIPHLNESWSLIQYMFYDKSAIMGYKTLNGTCVKSQFKEWEDGLRAKMGADNRMAEYLHIFTDTGNYATRYFPIIPNQSFYSDELARVFDLMMRDQLTPQQALDEVTTSVQADLDKVMSAS